MVIDDTLLAIQLKKDILLNSIDIFVKESLLHWLKQGFKQAANQKQGAVVLQPQIVSSSTRKKWSKMQMKSLWLEPKL